MRKKNIATLLTGLLALTGLSLVTGPSAHAATAPCDGTYSIAVGGWRSHWWDDRFFNVTQHVGYPTDIPNGASTQAGVNELNRLVREQRAACPGQHVKMMGYSMGAAVVHVWVTTNWMSFDNVNAILVADPKRQGPPGADGGTNVFGPAVGAPLAGVDRFFGNVPVKSICTVDYVCDTSANPLGYPADHINHYDVDFDGNHHNDNANEQWYNGVWMPW